VVQYKFQRWRYLGTDTVTATKSRGIFTLWVMARIRKILARHCMA